MNNEYTTLDRNCIDRSPGALLDIGNTYTSYFRSYDGNVYATVFLPTIGNYDIVTWPWTTFPNTISRSPNSDITLKNEGSIIFGYENVNPSTDLVVVGSFRIQFK